MNYKRIQIPERIQNALTNECDFQKMAKKESLAQPKKILHIRRFHN